MESCRSELGLIHISISITERKREIRLDHVPKIISPASSSLKTGSPSPLGREPARKGITARLDPWGAAKSPTENEVQKLYSKAFLSKAADSENPNPKPHLSFRAGMGSFFLFLLGFC